MEIAIIASKKDQASMNIRSNLIKTFSKTNISFDNESVYSYKNLRLYTINKESVYYEDIDKEINADFFIFISKHQSQAAIPTLSVHNIGNWSDNKVGGKKNTLVCASAFMINKAFLVLNELGKDSGYELVYEVTHHGPFLNKPTFFIEIGSTEKQWLDEKAGSIIASTLLKCLFQDNSISDVAIGIGGLHTCPEFNKISLRNKVALSHICPKYMLSSLNKEMLEEAINKTVEKVDYILLDWKGLGSEKQRVIELLKELNLNYKKTSSL
jgi:D-aminoacyl-tRNA deacylase